MLLSNLREPDWIPVACSQKLLHIAICRLKGSAKPSYTFTANKLSEYQCQPLHILMKEKCFYFLWKNVIDTNGMVCTEGRHILHKDVDKLYHVFDAVSSVDIFPKFILLNNETIQILTIRKYFNKPVFKYDSVSKDFTGGYLICYASKVRIKIGTNLFQCNKGGYISYALLCNDIMDCPNDSSDESDCECKQYTYLSHCKKISSLKNSSLCGTNYYRHLTGKCKMYLSRRFSMLNHNINIQCHPIENKINGSDSKMKREYLEEDEVILYQSREGNISSICSPKLIPCMEGYPNCFSFTDICIYKLDENNMLIPCRKGGHLENCEQFDCNMNFKCINSYCVSLKYVCDGKWDCPRGEDEANNEVCLE